MFSRPAVSGPATNSGVNGDAKGVSLIGTLVTEGLQPLSCVADPCGPNGELVRDRMPALYAPGVEIRRLFDGNWLCVCRDLSRIPRGLLLRSHRDDVVKCLLNRRPQNFFRPENVCLVISRNTCDSIPQETCQSVEKTDALVLAGYTRFVQIVTASVLLLLMVLLGVKIPWSEIAASVLRWAFG